jgi:hypothetical protein
VIEMIPSQAIQIKKDNFHEVSKFLPDDVKVAAGVPEKGVLEVSAREVPTLEGTRMAHVGDFISKDSRGNYHVGLYQEDDNEISK